MDVTAWICQGLLAVVFFASGVAKSTMSRERLLETGQTGAAVFPMPAVRVAAASELMAAAGLVLPWLTGIGRPLTPAAAAGLIVVMVIAAVTHWRLGEPRNVLGNLVLLTMCVVVIVVRVGQL